MSTFLIRTILVIGVLPISLMGCSANDTEPDESGELVAYDEPGPDPNQLVCKQQRPVGSHIPVRVCRTRAQIEADRERALRSTGPLRTMGGRPPPPSPTPP